MSEFTDGLLILKEHAPLAQAALADLKHPYIYKELNQKWSIIMLEQPDDPADAWVERYSRDFPLLYFWDAEDHGWGYIIFHEGKQKASLDVGYELSYTYWRQIAELLYPKIDIHGELDLKIARRIYRLVERSDAYRQEIKDQYINPNVKEFDVLGIPPERIMELRRLIRPSWYRKRVNDLRQVDVFKEIIGIEEMNWMSYYHLHRDMNP